MNSNQRLILAFSLSFLILVFYPIWLKKVAPPVPAAQKQTSVVEQTIVQPVLTQEVASSVMPRKKENRYAFASKYFNIEFSDLGASIIRMDLKNWGKANYAKETLIESGNEPGAFKIQIPNQGIEFQNLVFTVTALDEASGIAAFSAEVANSWRLEKKYIFAKDKPSFKIQVNVKNISEIPKKVALGIDSQLYLGDQQSRERMYDQFFEQLYDKLDATGVNKFEKKPHVVEGVIEWQALTKKYFSIFIKPDQNAAVSEASAPSKNPSMYFANLQLAPMDLAPGAEMKHEFFVYAGPQYYKMLKSFKNGFENILTQGFFGIFKLWLLMGLQWTYHVVRNYGWAIVIITMLIKLLFTPLTHMSFESMKKMQAVQPKIKALQEHYKNDQAKLMKEMSALYKKYNVKPMAGCLPMLLQIPVFIAFYHVLATTVELKGEPFIWWMKDLSAPDHAFMLPFTIPFIGNAINILPLLMMGSMVWQQKVTPQTMPADQQKMMTLMPIMFGFIFYNLPSGLVLYWFINNMLSIIHQMFVKTKPHPDLLEAE